MYLPGPLPQGAREKPRPGGAGRHTLVGGDMVEAEGRLAHLVQTVPVGAGRLKQSVSTDDIGFDKGRRTTD